MSQPRRHMDLDVTFIAQFVLVIALIAMLRPLLVAPLVEVLDARTEQIDGARQKTRQIERQGGQDRQTYQNRLREARHQVHMMREQLRQTGRDRAQQLEREARLALAQQLVRQRQALAEAELKAQTGLRTQTAAQAAALLTKLLGRKVSA